MKSTVGLAGITTVLCCLLFACTDDGGDGTTEPATISAITVSGIEPEPVRIELSQVVTLPVDEDDARLIAAECTCECAGEPERQGDYWVVYCCDWVPMCEIRIEVATGATSCAFYG